MAEEYLTVISGVIVGFVVAVSSNWINNWMKKRKQVLSVRASIIQEIDQNIKLLHYFNNNLNKKIEKHIGRREIIYSEHNRAKILVYQPLCSWNDITWKTQNYLLPIAFEDDELKKINKFYNQLEVLNSIYSSCSHLKEDTGENWQSKTPTGHYGHHTSYSDEAGELWRDFSKITLEILKKGNPLNKEK